MLLADRRVDPTVEDNAAVVRAAFCNQPDTLRVLLSDPRVDPRAQNSAALAVACVKGFTEVVRLLLGDERMRPLSDRLQHFMLAAQNNRVEVLRVLFGHSSMDDADADAKTLFLCLHASITKGHIESCEVSLSEARRQLSDICGSVLLRTCIELGRVDMMRLLLADRRFDMPSWSRQLAVMLIEEAIKHANAEAARTLLAHPTIGVAAKARWVWARVVDAATTRWSRIVEVARRRLGASGP